MRLLRPVLALGLATALLSSCAGTSDPQQSSTAQGSLATAQSASPEAQAFLAKHGLAGKSTTDVIDILDRLAVRDRPGDLRASVRPDVLLLSGDGVEVPLPLPSDRFYLSVAPYVNATHDCFNHALTSCKGELGNKQVQVELVEEGTGTVLAAGPRTLFDNGFVGFWLPKDVTANLTVVHDGKVAEAKVSTGADDPTCLTTMQLA
jgi:hypothetical protein